MFSREVRIDALSHASESLKFWSDVQFEITVETLWGKTKTGQTYIRVNGTGQRIPIFKMENVFRWMVGIHVKIKNKQSADDADVMNWYLHPIAVNPKGSVFDARQSGA